MQNFDGLSFSLKLSSPFRKVDGENCRRIAWPPSPAPPARVPAQLPSQCPHSAVSQNRLGGRGVSAGVQQSPLLLLRRAACGRWRDERSVHLARHDRGGRRLSCRNSRHLRVRRVGGPLRRGRNGPAPRHAGRGTRGRVHRGTPRCSARIHFHSQSVAPCAGPCQMGFAPQHRSRHRRSMKGSRAAQETKAWGWGSRREGKRERGVCTCTCGCGESSATNRGRKEGTEDGNDVLWADRLRPPHGRW